MEIYHVLNRGVEKRQIFMDDRDRVRFIHDLYEFNNTAPAGNSYKKFQNMDVRRPYFETDTNTTENDLRSGLKGRHRVTHDRDPLIKMHGWVLMGNHYHLLLSPRKENGISQFIKKLNGGYAKYFNERYERSGALWQGKTKKILVDSDAYFLHILHYIHLNPLDFLSTTKDWRTLQIKDANKALEHLTKYRWSSFLDYCGTKNFPSLIEKELFSEVFTDYKHEVTSYLKDLDLSEIEEYTLEYKASQPTILKH